MPTPHVLAVDDDDLQRQALVRALGGHYAVSTASNAELALEALGTQPVDLVVTDVCMPGINGVELVRQVRERWPDVPCIVMTGFASPADSVEALRAGAFWYIEKPFGRDFADVLHRLAEQALEHGRLRSENRELHGQIAARSGLESIVGRSEALRAVLDQIARVADTDSTVLLGGESGTGKELFAHAIHHGSRRARRMFVTVNCGAIPEHLLESELFGHVRGAFTNAFANRQGRFALADGGTIFLDEIGDMSATLQVKLLRVLQDRTFEPVGSSKSTTVDVRVIAATHQDLETAVREKRFRQALFYRLNVIPIRVPPLRDRRDDVPLLVDHFLQKLARERGQRPPQIGPEVLARLCDYDWPGNVRELENLVERLVVFAADRTVTLDDLPEPIHERAPGREAAAPRLPAGGLRLVEAVERFEADLILQALERTNWNKQRAAALLGMNRPTLFSKIQRAGLHRREEAVRAADV